MIPEEQWTKSQREFVGTQFPTPKGGVLTVVGINNEGSRVKFICECSLCSKDKELWPYGSIVGAKRILLNNQLFCGCSKSPKWKEWQQRIRVGRICNEKGYIFHDWYGEFKGSHTKLDLENPSTGCRWNSISINGLLSGRGDPVEGRNKSIKSRTKDDEEHIKDFYKLGNFSEDYVFWRSVDDGEKYKNYWNYICPICSNDEYVKNGLCSGVFKSYVSSLKAGNKSCRCTSWFHWSQEQREYQINKVCKEEGLTFSRWESKEGYKNAFSKFKWVCSYKHSCTSDISNFLLRGNRCDTCRNEKLKKVSGYYGYYPDRVDEDDYLYILNFNNKYVKVGRSFNIYKRIDQLVGESKVNREDIKILKVLTAKHQIIFDTEQWLHEELTGRGFYYNNSDGLWSTELFKLDCLLTLTYIFKDTYLEDVSDRYK